jgi:hypothetical protein
MSDPLSSYVGERLAERLAARSPVVWYDPRCEFEAWARFGDVAVDGRPAHFIRYEGSLFALRAAAEPFLAGDHPEPVVLYIGGLERDAHESPLMELEVSGTTWEPQLKRLARNVLRQKFTDGAVDEALNAENVTYATLAALTLQGGSGEAVSVLKAIHGDISGDTLIANWMVSDEHDAEIDSKGARSELLKLLSSRLGAAFPDADSSAKLRAGLRRFVLANEFRLDLKGEGPPTLSAVPAATRVDHQTFLRQVAARLRREHAAAYPSIADAVQEELGLAAAGIDASRLGSIDTFRFEERDLLRYCDERIAAGYWQETLDVIRERTSSFWVDRDVRRKAQWNTCQAIAEVAQSAAGARDAIAGLPDQAKGWVDAYCSETGVHRVDRAYRQMETLVASMDEDVVVDRALIFVRTEYESLLGEMARRFSSAFVKSNWSVDGVLHQTDCYAKIVAPQPRLTAYFFVDAMRYEMGVALRDRLRELGEPVIVPAVAALPTITPMGMAALLPGAASSFSVVAENGRLGSKIDGSFLPGVVERRKFLAARVPGAVDITLDQVLRDTPSTLRKKLEGATLVNVRSQEIDAAGEGGFLSHARQMMDSVLNNLTRAVRRLASAGVETFVISADHGHQFSMEKDDSMKIDAPGGDTVELHRRCWMGRGGKTPPGCARVSSSDLGYDSDLDFVFPLSLGIFKAGGDPAFHHGAITLQELIVPVITLHWTAPPSETSRPRQSILVTGIPEAITNRMPTVAITREQLGLAPLKVKPVLMAGQRQVGKAGVALNAELDRENGIVTLGKNQATVGIIVDVEDAQLVRIIVLDAETDGILYQSSDIPLKLVM